MWAVPSVSDGVDVNEMWIPHLNTEKLICFGAKQQTFIVRRTAGQEYPSVLSALSSLGLRHDQSLFLLTELQTAQNRDEIGLQIEVEPFFFHFPPFYLP